MGEQLTLGRAGFRAEPTPTPVPGYTPAPTPWELGEQLRRIEEKLDLLLERLGGD